MTINKGNNLFFGLSVLLVIVGLVILVFILAADQNVDTRIEIIGIIAGSVYPTVAYFVSELQKRNLRFFLLVKRLHSLFDQQVLTWDLAATLYSPSVASTTLDAISTALMETRGAKTSVRVKVVNVFSRVIEISPGPSLDILFTPAVSNSIDGGKELSYLQVRISNYRVGYHQAAYAIQHEIIPVLEIISRVVNDAEAKYTLSVEFDASGNPFFGLFVSHLPADAVSNFTIRLVVNDYGQGDTVTVNRSKLAINTRTHSALLNLALELLAFGPRAQRRLQNAG